MYEELTSDNESARGMSNRNMNKTDQIRSILSGLEPLTVTSTRQIHDEMSPSNPGLHYHTVREAVQKVSLGSKTAERRKTPNFFAVYLTLPELNAAGRKEDIILSLPGIKRVFIRYMAQSEIEAMKSSLSAHYSPEVIGYWVRSAQLRSVDVITAKHKKEVIARDKGRCRLCKHIETVFAQSGVGIPNSLNWITQPPMKPTICHIISRRAVFWYLLKEIHETDKLDIFSRQGVVEFTARLRSDELHSSPKNMVYLCQKHDRLVQQALTT